MHTVVVGEMRQDNACTIRCIFSQKEIAVNFILKNYLVP